MTGSISADLIKAAWGTQVVAQLREYRRRRQAQAQSPRPAAPPAKETVAAGQAVRQ